MSDEFFVPIVTQPSNGLDTTSLRSHHHVGSRVAVTSPPADRSATGPAARCNRRRSRPVGRRRANRGTTGPTPRSPWASWREAMSKRPKRIEGGLFDVREIVHDERRRWEFAIALTCALDGKTPEEVIRQIEEDHKEERKRIAKYGPPLDETQKPWPQEAECADCGKIACPFGGFQQYLTDI